MEHVTEGLYLAAAAAFFVLAVSVMLLEGRAVDRLFGALREVQPGAVVTGEAYMDE